MISVSDPPSPGPFVFLGTCLLQPQPLTLITEPLLPRSMGTVGTVSGKRK